MMASGIFPDALKVSKVIPLYKNGDESNLSNYRPIALSPSISKIFEKAILTQLTLYLEDNKIIHPHQYVFVNFTPQNMPLFILLTTLNTKWMLGRFR